MKSKKRLNEVEIWENKGALFKSIYSSNPGYDNETAYLNDYLEKETLKRLLSKTKKTSFENALDIGAGTGRFSIFLSSFCKKVTTIEPTNDLFEQLKENTKGLNNIINIKKNIQSFNPDKKYDLILISGVLTYFDETEMKVLLKKITSLLEKKGILIIRDFIANKYWVTNENYIYELDFWKKQFKENELFILSYYPVHPPFLMYHISKKIKMPIHKIPYKYLKKYYSFVNNYSDKFNFIYDLLKHNHRMYFFILEKK